MHCKGIVSFFLFAVLFPFVAVVTMLVETLTLLFRVSSVVASLSCLDEGGNPVDCENGMMKNTFEQMFLLKNSTSALYGMYNDEKPMALVDASAYTWGHLKGAVAFDNSSGFWIIHSIPKLSDALDHYHYPLNGKVYGQHMLCVTLSSVYMLPVGESL
ncbi:hypothetical protein FBUS_11690 [Fasciolopsis buskii]|uniref:Uncharacterized protein n=1 Tax=Fasciolopsis buskii TaxID=27845 RepID=A0A8E0VKP9_9TREM|nr:hypothetical protein FBUS_11690 [Fasciolopsis buski]